MSQENDIYPKYRVVRNSATKRYIVQSLLRKGGTWQSTVFDRYRYKWHALQIAEIRARRAAHSHNLYKALRYSTEEVVWGPKP